MISIENLSSPLTVPQTPQKSKLHPSDHLLSFSSSCPPAKTSLPTSSDQPETCETCSITTTTTKVTVSSTILAAGNDLGSTKEGTVSSSSYDDDDDHDKCKSNDLQEPETVGYQDSLPKFSIRDYVFASRKVDVCNNWPFSNKSLQLCLKHGVKDLLPPFQALGTLCDNSPIGIPTVVNNTLREVRSSCSYKISSLPLDNQLTSDSTTVSGAGEAQKLASQHCLLHVETRRDDKDLESNSSIPCQSTLESVCTKNKLPSEIIHHREDDAASLAAMCDSNGNLSKPSYKQTTSSVLDTKSSHKLNDCTPMSELAAPCEFMASKVCPVCGTFSSSSNTTLNAHIDQCLSMNTCSDKKDTINTSADKKENLPTSKPRVKPRKIRLITDIYATARCCTLEDLDKRNGTNWFSEATNMLTEATDAVAGLKKQRVVSRQICNSAGDGAVYIDTDGTKIRVLSSFDDTSSASKTATDLRMTKKSLKDDRQRKSIAPNKECLAANHDKQIPQRKEFPLKSCSLKAGRYDEAERAVEGCQRDGKHRSPASRAEQQNRLTDAGMLKKWVRSKRTGFSKRGTNLRILCHSVREVEERREIAADGDRPCPGKSCLTVDVLKHSPISENCISSVNSLKVDDEVSIEAGAGDDWCSPRRKRLDAPLCRGPKRAGMNSMRQGAVEIHRGDGVNRCSPKRKRLGAPLCRGLKRASMSSTCEDAVEIHQGDGENNWDSPKRKRLDAPLSRGPQSAGMNSLRKDANEIHPGAVEKVDRSVCSSRTSGHRHALSSERRESVSMRKKIYLPSTSPGPTQQLKGDKNDSFLMCRLNRVSEEMVQWPAEASRSDDPIQGKKHNFAKTSAETSLGYHKQAEERSNDCLGGLADKPNGWRDSPSAMAMERAVERDADLHEFRTRFDRHEECRAHSFTEESAESALGYHNQGEERINGCLDGVADKPKDVDSPSALVIGRTLERCADLHEYPTLFDTQLCPEDYQVHSFKEASAPQNEPSSGADEVGHDSAELKIADSVLNVRPDSSFLFIDPIPIPGPPGSDLPSPRDMEAEVLRVNQSLMNSQVDCWYYKKPKEMADGDSQESPTSATTTISNLMEVVSDSRNSEPCMESHPVIVRRLQERDNPSFSAVDTRHEEKATRWPQSEISDVDGAQRGVISTFPGQSCCSWEEGISWDAGSIRSEDHKKGSICSVMNPAVGRQVMINQAISGTERPSTQSPGEKLVGSTVAREVVAACGRMPPTSPSHCGDSDSPPSISPSTLVFRLMGKNLTIINNDKSTHAWVQPVFNSSANKGASTISGAAGGDQEPHHVGAENDRLWQGYI